jgi:hypothetical protein
VHVWVPIKSRDVLGFCSVFPLVLHLSYYSACENRPTFRVSLTDNRYERMGVMEQVTQRVRYDRQDPI